MYLLSLLPSSWDPSQALENLSSSEEFIRGLTDAFILTIVYGGGLALLFALTRTIYSVIRTAHYTLALVARKNSKSFADSRQEWSSRKWLPLASHFNDLLVEVPRADGSLDRDLKRCGDASDVFNERSLAHGIVGNRLLIAMPAILTGLGVLGTFVGLQLGIGGLELGGSEIEELDKSITPLIRGSATAFSTSVWGVLCSLIFAISEKLMEALARLPIRHLQSRINRLVPLYLPEQSMIELHRASAESESILRGLAVAIGEQMQTAVQQLGANLTAAVKDSLGGQSTLQSTVTEAVARLESHGKVAADIQQAAATLNAAAEKLATMRETFEIAAQRYDSAAQSQEKAASAGERTAQAYQKLPETITELAGTLQTAGSEIATGAVKARETYEVLVGLQKQWFDGVEVGLKAMRDQLQDIISTYGERVDGEIRHLMQLWTSAVEESLQKFAVQVQMIDGAINELLTSKSEGS